MVIPNYGYDRDSFPSQSDPNRELRELMLSQLAESDRCLKAAEQLLAPLEAEAALVLELDRRAQAESKSSSATVVGSRSAAEIPRLRSVLLRWWSWCFGGKVLDYSENAKLIHGEKDA